VPAAAKTVAISACAKEMKHCTTAGSNCVPLDELSGTPRGIQRTVK
jgi:hypothetical protein